MSFLTKTILEFIIFTFKCVLALFIVTIVFIGLIIYQNSIVKVTNYQVKNKKIPKSFDGYKIIQLSDIHNDYSGDKLSKLVEKIKKEQPEMIVITGDLVDSIRYDEDNTLEFIESVTSIAPTYFVYGNHDVVIDGDIHSPGLLKEIENKGARVLNIKNEKITKNGEIINLIGIQDPSTVYNIEDLRVLNSEKEIIESMLTSVTMDINTTDEFTLLLSHRPEHFDIYEKYEIDLALSGHAHGGQFRIPFVGGLYAPHQGIFPKYTSGKHSKNNTEMIVSRGLGASRFPFRVFNTPEIVSITLKTDI